jgi:hypothetical protein
MTRWRKESRPTELRAKCHFTDDEYTLSGVSSEMLPAASSYSLATQAGRKGSTDCGVAG